MAQAEPPLAMELPPLLLAFQSSPLEPPFQPPQPMEEPPATEPPEPPPLPTEVLLPSQVELLEDTLLPPEELLELLEDQLLLFPSQLVTPL